MARSRREGMSESFGPLDKFVLVPSGSYSIAGMSLRMSGLRVGTQAQVMPTLTSTALHMSDKEACQAKSAWPPKVAAGSLVVPVVTSLTARCK